MLRRPQPILETAVVLLCAAFLAPAHAQSPAPSAPVEAPAAEPAELDQRIGGLETRLKRLAGALEAMSQRLSEAQGQIQALQAENQTLTERLAAQGVQVPGGSPQPAPPERAQVQELREKLAAVQAALEQSTQQNSALEGQVAALQRQLDPLRARLPPEEGGSATLDGARQQAADAARAYSASLAAHPSASEPGAREALDKDRRALLAAQSLVARLSGARGLFTVGSGDSLSRIAALLYRNGQRWRDILKANQHVIERPDHLPPGLVLVLP